MRRLACAAGAILSLQLLGCGGAEEVSFPGISRASPADVVLEEKRLDLVAPVGSEPVSTLVAANGESYALVRVANVRPPELEGEPVHANDIVLDTGSDRAYVAYNYQGGPWRGAVQIVDLGSPREPVVRAEFHFAHMDVNALDLERRTLFLSGAADPDVSGGFLAFLAYQRASARSPRQLMRSVVGLPSFAGTGVAATPIRTFASSGARGGSIEVFDSTMVRVDGVAISDIRDIEEFEDGLVVVAGTTDNPNAQGSIVLYRGDGFDNPTFLPVEDFASDFRKAAIEVWDGHLALFGLSAAGLKILDTRAPQEFVFEAPNPTAEGEEPRSDTNSATTDGLFLFTANSEYGFSVWRPDAEFNAFTLLGYHRPGGGGEAGSVTHIEAKAGRLLVGTKSRGVFVYLIESESVRGGP